MNRKNKQFLNELNIYSELGVRILLEDKASTPQEIYQTCILREDMPYMCDFIFKEDEKLSELHFNKVTKPNYFKLP